MLPVVDKGPSVGAVRQISSGAWVLVGLFCALVLMIEASKVCNNISCQGNTAYSVAGGVVAFVVTAVRLYLEVKYDSEEWIKIITSGFLFFWWVVLASISTFISPFRTPCNGYFAAWGGVIAALQVLFNDAQNLKEVVDHFQERGVKMGIVLIGSVVVLAASAFDCAGAEGCQPTTIYGISASGLSLLLSLLRVFVEFGDDFTAVLNIFLAILWVATFFVLTFFSPFTSLSNGYFATWLCTVASVLLIEQ
jgi:hypothetical protein